MEQGAQVEVKSYLRYDPPICKVVIAEGSITKGDYIPEIGQVVGVEDDGDEIETAEAREKPYILTTRVSDGMFKDLSPHLQMKTLLQVSDQLSKLTKALYNRYGIDGDLEGNEDDDHKDEDPLQRFYREYGGGKRFQQFK
ncbi:hypothetical protein HDV00_009686 [Rhizophlyctis rosea]|nr:hypothetical protein HDV00_009686 [Rhizophlyctis rosea]